MFYSARRFVLCLTLFYFVLVFSSPISISITSLEKRVLSAFRTVVRFAIVWVSVSSSSWCLGRAAVCDCGTPWTFLLPFFKLCTRHKENRTFEFVKQITSTSPSLYHNVKEHNYYFENVAYAHGLKSQISNKNSDNNNNKIFA